MAWKSNISSTWLNHETEQSNSSANQENLLDAHLERKGVTTDKFRLAVSGIPEDGASEDIIASHLLRPRKGIEKHINATQPTPNTIYLSSSPGGWSRKP